MINMSFFTQDVPSVKSACDAAFSAGVPMAVAAGNNNAVADSVAPCKSELLFLFLYY